MKAADIMTRRVIKVNVKSSITEAARLMLQHKVSGLPVVDDDYRLVGIISESDFLHRKELHTQKKHRRWIEFKAPELLHKNIRTHTAGLFKT